MVEYDFEIHPGEARQRLDRYLVKHLPQNLSRSYIQRLIKEGAITLDGKKVRTHHFLRGGERVRADIPKPRKLKVEAEDIPLKIVYEDEHLLVIDKPAGMVVHPAPGNFAGTLVNALLAHCRDLSGIGGVTRPGIVHRLDKDTSGLMLAAKTDLAHHELAWQMKQRTIKKRYLCLVKGVVEMSEGIIDAPVGRNPSNRKKMAVRYSGGRPALTRFRVVKRFRDYSMLEVELKSGRTHQIRLHLSHYGHPVLGDPLYGTKDERIPRQALHSWMIGFLHPAGKRYLEFKSEPPEDIRKLIDSEGIREGLSSGDW